MAIPFLSNLRRDVKEFGVAPLFIDTVKSLPQAYENVREVIKKPIRKFFVPQNREEILFDLRQEKALKRRGLNFITPQPKLQAYKPGQSVSLKESITPEEKQQVIEREMQQTFIPPIPSSKDFFEEPMFFDPFGATGAVRRKVVQKGKQLLPKSQPIFQGLKNLSTKLFEEFKGLPEKIKVGRFEEIVNKVKKSGIKEVDEQLVRRSLVIEKGQVNLSKTAAKVEEQLIPLTPTPVKSPRWSNIGEEFIGDGKYGEIVYQSPIKTSAGDVHFPYRGYANEITKAGETPYPNYFSHVRYEDMADGKTRKILETQSDLMQKGKLETSIRLPGTPTKLPQLNALNNLIEIGRQNGKTKEQIFESLRVSQPKLLKDLNVTSSEDFSDIVRQAKENIGKSQEYAKLAQYESNDPLAHLRTFREEVKRAAKDGKDTILIPSGETAMKIEGLGETQTFKWANGQIAESKDLKTGYNIFDKNNNDHWIITDILGDGKFKAVHSTQIYENVPDIKNATGIFKPDDVVELSNGKFYQKRFTETFDISGKVDTKHFVYKLNEEAIPREARKMGLIVEKVQNLNKADPFIMTTRETVPGSWWKIKIPKEHSKLPIEAFGGFAGIEQDEEGGMGFSPEKAALGFAGMSTMRGDMKKFLLPIAGITAATAPLFISSKTTYKKQDAKSLNIEQKTNTFDRESVANRIRHIETQGISDEQAITTVGITGDLGKYQVNPKSLKDWSKLWLGKKYTPEEFLNDPEAQEQFFDEFLNVAERYNLTPDEAAVSWHRGWGELGQGQRSTKEKRFRNRLTQMMTEETSQRYLEKFNR